MPNEALVGYRKRGIFALNQHRRFRDSKSIARRTTTRTTHRHRQNGTYFIQNNILRALANFTSRRSNTTSKSRTTVNQLPKPATNRAQTNIIPQISVRIGKTVSDAILIRYVFSLAANTVLPLLLQELLHAVLVRKLNLSAL